jgi:hypothetical protein
LICGGNLHSFRVTVVRDPQVPCSESTPAGLGILSTK